MASAGARGVVRAEHVSRDEAGLRELLRTGYLRAAINLTAVLLSAAQQGKEIFFFYFFCVTALICAVDCRFDPHRKQMYLRKKYVLGFINLTNRFIELVVCFSLPSPK